MKTRPAEKSPTWSQLADDLFVTLRLGTSIRLLTDAAFREARATPRSTLETSTVSTAGAIVAAGLGVTAVPEPTLPLLAFADVAHRPLHAPLMTCRLMLLTRPEGELSAPARRTRDHLLSASAPMRGGTWNPVTAAGRSCW